MRGGGQGFRGRGGPVRQPRQASGVVVELGEYLHSTPEHMLFKSTSSDVPMFNQPVSTSEKGEPALGKVDEILGPVSHYFFTVIPALGVKIDKVKPGQKVYMDRAFLLPLDRFLNPPKSSLGGGRGGFRCGAR